MASSLLLKSIRVMVGTLGLLSLAFVVFMARQLEYSDANFEMISLGPDTSLGEGRRRVKTAAATESPGVIENDSKSVVETSMGSQGRRSTETQNQQPQQSADPHHANKTVVDRITKDDAATSIDDENVLVVIISNRRGGIIPTLASIIRTSTKPVDVVLIGEHKINEQVHAHFGNRINEFTSMSVKDITDDLESQGFKPIWTWPDWHTSMDPGWKNENTLHVGAWDNLHTHAHELNHLRFYLPHVSVFKEKSYFYFLDDDILVQKDLGLLAHNTMNNLDNKHGLVCPCNIWMWNSECFHFEFQSKKDYILSMPSLYGDRDVCKTDSESHCVPPNYWDFVDSVMPEGGKDQHAWNFGFSLFALKNWRDLKLTEKYEVVMKENYRLHVFPETSLTFGLGVSYIAFAGNVECWNEDYVQVRDGFGFIEWDRYARTFGKDFFNSVDVVHFTGPDKPWVDESRIETRAITPWLKIMELEKMPIPVQLPEQPTENLFTLLSSERSGAHWMMSMLDTHPKVCASGENDRPETGFPSDVLLPEGVSWYPKCSIKKGCTYQFIRKSIKELTSNVTDANVPLRCTPEYDAFANGDPLVEHIEQLCNFVKMLDGNYDRASIAKLYVDAFIAEDRQLMGCGCVRGVEAKGLKVMADWVLPKGFPFEQSGKPAIDLDQTKVHGSKIIRLKRRNLWARYKSMLMAQQTNMFHPSSPAEKQSQIEALKPITVDIEHMEWNMKRMAAVDEAGDRWAQEHSSEILWLDYENCRADTAGCFKKIYSFVGVDDSLVTGKKASMYESVFASFQNSDSTMDHIANKGEILELLGVNGWVHYVSDERYIPIQFLLYEENDLIVDTRQYMGINATLFGQDKKAEGHGSKYSAALPILKNMDKDSLVVLSNNIDGWVNFPIGGHESVFTFLHNFKKTMEKLTNEKPGSVVLSTDSDCCASALTHANPGDFFDEHGKRKSRACLSGEEGCMWAGNDKALPWQSFMKDLASRHSEESSIHIYLDTALIGGKAGDLVKLIESTDIAKTEDDRAVLADFMYRNPDLISLDYKQEVFGASRKASQSTTTDACLVGTDDATAVDRRLEILETKPLFMYSPQSLGCGDVPQSSPPRYPLWDQNGIILQPLTDHIERVVERNTSIVHPAKYTEKVEYSQGPEVLYVIEGKGIWTSKLIRDRTDSTTFNWRLLPTEGLFHMALGILRDEHISSSRWSSLTRVIERGSFPIWTWYGDYKSCNFHNYGEDSIPLFTTCAVAECNHTFPMPNYMSIIDSQQSASHWKGVFEEFEDEYPWETKRRRAVWRGALSEADHTLALTSVRWRFAKLVHELQSPLFDAGLTGIPFWLTDIMEFNMTEIGGFAKGISPMKKFQDYMAILDMDGNSWSSRFGTLLCYNSVVIKVEPDYFEYFYADLKPWTHYIPVKHDLSDLHENVQWALDPKNEAVVKDIITSANQWCSHTLISSELAANLLDIWEGYVRLLDRADSNWQTAWDTKRDELFAASDIGMFQLVEGL